ncbi:MAG: glycosyl transferase family 2 [Candidatus Tectimicrobiota bacterium]|nr:MAG: glycosyl transferase family 2 [Candidatus Tectomicrobia bacterium]
MTRDSQEAQVEVSVVIPIRNERDNLPELYAHLRRALAQLQRPYEVVFVDDGSSDGSLAFCQELAAGDPRVVVVALRRPFGKATALQAGFAVASGQVIVTMDGDLQDDAGEISRLLKALEEGYDLVTGWRHRRQDRLGKRLASRLFNLTTAFFTGLHLHDFNSGLKAYRREVARGLDLYGELHRYVPVLAHAKGFRVGEVPVRHHPRRHGTSKYRLERFLRGALDLLAVLFLSHYQRRPLHLFGLVGGAFLLAGLGIDGYLTVLWWLGKGPIGTRPLLVLGSLLITVGVQLFFFGLLAELITATSYRRGDVTELIRHVYRQQTALPPSLVDAPRER